MLTVSAQPSTIDDVQSEITKWIGGGSKASNNLCTFSREPEESALSIFILHSRDDLKVEMFERCLNLQTKQKKLSLNLSKFRIWTEFVSDKLCFKIDHDPDLDHWLVSSLLRDFSDTKHPAFVSRMFRVVQGLESDLTTERIEEATAAPTDQLVLLEALFSSAWAAELSAQDPLLAAKLRGIERRREMLETAGGALSSERVAEILNISRQAVDKRRAAGQLLALTQGKRGYSYPGFQFEEGKTLEGLEDALSELRQLDPWMQLIFFSSPNERLGNKSPIDALRKGKQKDVAAIARTFGEQGAL